MWPPHCIFRMQLKTAITRANSRSDLATIRDALEVSAEMYRKDPNNVQDYVQRHLLSLSVWEELRYVILSARWPDQFHFEVWHSSLIWGSCKSVAHALIIDRRFARIMLILPFTLELFGSKKNYTKKSNEKCNSEKKNIMTRSCIEFTQIWLSTYYHLICLWNHGT